VSRGDVYEVRLPSKGGGHQQQGRRYAVILQVDELLGLSTVIVAPTSTRAQPATFRPEIEIGGESTRVLVEQLRAVDVGNLTGFAGHLGAAEQARVDDAVTLVLGL
jgi:mRNA interferase MazF